MQYRRLGRHGLKVSRLCLGTMMFGGECDEAEATRIVAFARDVGINAVDCADTYNKGRAEEVLGRCIAQDRDAWILSTKVGKTSAQDPNVGGLSRKWIMRGAEASLRRLGTDYIDIYYLHTEDHATPLEETVRAMSDLQRQGKIRYFGVSNYRAWRLAEICRLCDALGIDRPIASQPYYHALNRTPELEHLPACRHYGLGVISYSPLARGVLTGKYDALKSPPLDTRAGRGDRRMLEAEWRPEALAIAHTIREHAERRGLSSVQFAVAWVLNNALVSATIAGPRTLAQLEQYMGALEVTLTPEDEAFVDGLVASGHPATRGYNDPAYPIEGRVLRLD